MRGGLLCRLFGFRKKGVARVCRGNGIGSGEGGNRYKGGCDGGRRRVEKRSLVKGFEKVGQDGELVPQCFWLVGKIGCWSDSYGPHRYCPRHVYVWSDGRTCTLVRLARLSRLIVTEVPNFPLDTALTRPPLVASHMAAPTIQARMIHFPPLRLLLARP